MGSIDKACISGFLCRLCSEMHRIVIHIYGDQGQRLCLVEKINGYLPITISPTDPLPKTICTTCLRRVEQHYDLLMRLSRIREEKFLRLNSYKKQPSVSSISSLDNSEDEVYQSDDEARRRYQQLGTPQRQISQTQNTLSSPSISVAPLLISARTDASVNRTNVVASTNNNDNVEDTNDANDDHSEASTSATAMATISQNINIINDNSIAAYSSSAIHPFYSESGNSFGIVVQQHSD